MSSIFGRRLFNHPSLGPLNKRPDVVLMDSSASFLPSGSNLSIDGVKLDNHQRVLFTALSSGNNMVYQCSGVSDPHSGVQWALAVDDASTNGLPQKGDMLFVQEGSSNMERLLGWNGLSWQDLEAALISPSGSISANLSGNVTGNVSGNLTGSVAGHASLDVALSGATMTGPLHLAGKFAGVSFQPSANPYTIAANDEIIWQNIDNQVSTLPSATGSGRTIKFVIQSPSTVLNIYPQTGDQIDALTVSAQYQLWAAAFSISLTDVAAGHWASN
jgi:hypothetical protein